MSKFLGFHCGRVKLDQTTWERQTHVPLPPHSLFKPCFELQNTWDQKGFRVQTSSVFVTSARYRPLGEGTWIFAWTSIISQKPFTHSLQVTLYNICIVPVLTATFMCGIFQLWHLDGIQNFLDLEDFRLSDWSVQPLLEMLRKICSWKKMEDRCGGTHL